MTLGKENLKSLEAMGSAELRGWASQFIATGDSWPLDLFFTGRSPAESLIVFVRDFLPDGSYRLRERLQTEIARLAGSVAPDEDTKFDYLWDVITVATRLKAYHLKRVLLPIINGGDFRGRQGRSEDLHLCFIEALTDLGLHASEVSILRKRDLEDPRYSAAAYRALYRARPDWAVKHFPQVAATILSSETDYVLEMTFVLEDLLAMFGESFIVNHLSLCAVNMGEKSVVDLFFEAIPDVFPTYGRELYGRIVDNLSMHGWDISPYSFSVGDAAILTRRGDRTVVSTNKKLSEYLFEQGFDKKKSYAQTLDAVTPDLNELCEYNS